MPKQDRLRLVELLEMANEAYPDGFLAEYYDRKTGKPLQGNVDAFMGILPITILPFSNLIQRLPIRTMRRIWKGKADLDRMIFAMIEERRKSPGDRGDLLSMLLESTDIDTDGTGMSDQQIHDECMTILLAGHETTSNALIFSLWLLAKHPEIQQPSMKRRPRF